MELAHVLVALRRAWWFVVIGALLGVGGAVAVNASSAVEYRAGVELFVAMSDQDRSVGNALSGSQFALQRVKSYLQVADSAQVLEPVISRLRLPFTTDQLADHVTATNALDTVLIQITVTDTDPHRAAVVADAVGDQFQAVVEELEAPSDGGSSPVKVTTIEQATVPRAPVAPRRRLNLVLGLLAGLAVGVGAGLLRYRLDTTLKTADDIAGLTGALPLGSVPHDSAVRDQPLVLADQSGARAEAFRSLRTNLNFVDVDSPPRSIVVTSPLSGDGKTTTACNIALTLALNGARVVLVEADLRRPRACHYLGLDNAAGLTDVLAGQLQLRDVLADWRRGLMTVLPAGPIPPNPAELLGSRQMSALLHELHASFDHVIIDSAPLLPVTDAAVLAAAADGALVVFRHGRTRRDQAEQALEALSAVKARLLGTVINSVPKRKFAGYGYGYGSQAPRVATTPDLVPVESVDLTATGAPPVEPAGEEPTIVELATVEPTTRETAGPETRMPEPKTLEPALLEPQTLEPALLEPQTLEPAGSSDTPADADRRPPVADVPAQRLDLDALDDVPAVDRPVGWFEPDGTAPPPRIDLRTDLLVIRTGRPADAADGPSGVGSTRHNAPRNTPPRGTSITGTPPNGTPVRGRHPGRNYTAGRHRRH